MPEIVLRAAAAGDFARIVELNAAEVAQTSPMDLARLRLLAALAAYHKVAEVDGRVAAFMLAMDHTAAYDNDNFRWFAARYPRFLYIDRIVVDAGHAGLGIGSRLYRDLFEHARRAGIGTLVCEYNLDPPNPASAAFHARFGFVEVGARRLADGSKRVSMQAADVPPHGSTGITA
jgi:predicted GNAT superfamily acetyltransferase